MKTTILCAAIGFLSGGFAGAATGVIFGFILRLIVAAIFRV